jgi:hypothetical protein
MLMLLQQLVIPRGAVQIHPARAVRWQKACHITNRL